MSDANPSNGLPVVVFAAFPVPGHTNPVLKVCRHLRAEGFPCFFLGAESFKAKIEAAGAEFYPLPLKIRPGTFQEQWEYERGPPRLNFQMKNIFFDAAAAQAELLKGLLEDVKTKHPERRVVIVKESLFMGDMPFLLGAPLPRGHDSFPKVISLHTSVLFWHTPGMPLFGKSSPLPQSDEDRARYIKLAKEFDQTYLSTTDFANGVFSSAGATRKWQGWWTNRMMDTVDTSYCLCSPSLEFERSDLSSNVQFCGGLPRDEVPDQEDDQELWEKLKANASLPRGDARRKKLVFISQGTANLEYTDLLMPAVTGLADRTDAIIVATLGHAEKELPPDFKMPTNTHIVRYMPYDLILPITDAFVLNAGYGGFMHGVMSGTPMVFAGQAGDKGETSMRGGMSGIGIDLRTQEATPDMVREAVDRVLREEHFRQRAKEIMEENMAMDSLGTIAKKVLEYASC